MEVRGCVETGEILECYTMERGGDLERATKFRRCGILHEISVAGNIDSQVAEQRNTPTEGGKQSPVDRSYEYIGICPAMSATNQGLEELCDLGGSTRGPKLNFDGRVGRPKEQGLEYLSWVCMRTHNNDVGPETR
jgi:hypothetical protein